MKKERKLNKTEKLCKPNVGAPSCGNTRKTDATVPNLNQNKAGITLVALVITIIVLLILAAITINLTIGQRGILTRAEEAGRNYQEAAKREDEQLSNFLKEADDIIDGINGESKPLPENALAKKVQIGDYVAYDPKEGVTDTSKLSYTSPVGTGSSHGNGYTDTPEGQTFNVEENTKWRVLSKDEQTGEVVLISEAPMHQFGMKGAIGYLYAEQELNEICKIYGYGKGANTGKTFRYKTGDVVEGLTEGSITGSGARSITVEDINEITKYNPSTFFTPEGSGTIYYKYGDEYTHTIYHPTKTQPSGASTSATERTDKFTAYDYEGSQYLTDTTSPIYQMLFGSSNDLVYWVASRGVDSSSGGAGFGVFVVIEGYVIGYSGLCHGNSVILDEGGDAFGVRPIVYLKSNIQTSAKDASGAWIISE